MRIWIGNNLLVSRKGFEKLTEEFCQWLNTELDARASSEPNNNTEERHTYHTNMMEMMNRFIWGEGLYVARKDHHAIPGEAE